MLGHCLGRNGVPRVTSHEPTLWQHLFEWQRLGLRPLTTWKQRLVIALDVAREIESLHSSPKSLVLKELNPSTILVGDDLQAKLAAGTSLDDTAIQSTFSLPTKVYYAGPLYNNAPPDYRGFGDGYMTPRVIIYAFGLLLMQLITGMKGIKDARMPAGTLCLVPWFRDTLLSSDHQTLRNAIDTVLSHDDETFNESILRVAELADRCASVNNEERPDIVYVERPDIVYVVSVLASLC